jgi:hypothetical protein
VYICLKGILKTRAKWSTCHNVGELIKELENQLITLLHPVEVGMSDFYKLANFCLLFWDNGVYSKRWMVGK